MSDLVTVYVKLLDEGTDVWRPVQERRLHGRSFRLIGQPENDEKWEFAAGSTVVCERRELSDGVCDVAVRLTT